MADGQITIAVTLEDGSVVKGVADIGKSLSGVEKGGKKASVSIKSLASALGLVKIASKAFEVLKNSVSGAVDRFDTLQKYPKVMKALGFSADDSKKSVDKLSKGIDGLPTKLNDVVATAQRMTAITGNMDKSTDATIALNNAMLASGASTDEAARGLDQYLQMLSTGTVDLESWKTLQETMPIALQKVAEAFGYTGESAQRDLYDALKKGDIVFSDFQDKLIELGTGTGSLAKLAKENSLGIKTSFSNLGNAVIKGVANVIAKADELSQALTGKNIAQNIDSAKGMINGAFDEIVKIMDEVIAHSEDIKKAFELLADVAWALVPALAAATGAYLGFKTATAVGSMADGATKGIKFLISQCETLQILLLILTQDGLKAFGIALLQLVSGPIKALVAALGGPAVAIPMLIAAIVSALVALYATNETFRNSVNRLATIVKDGLIKAFQVLKSILSAILPTLTTVAGVVGGALLSAFQKLVEVGSKIASVVGPALSDFASKVKLLASSGFQKLVELISKVAEVLGGAFSKGLEIGGNLLERLGGSFGKIGGAISIAISLLTKVGIVALGLTGPMGTMISLIVSFLAAWAKTGDFSADGITKVFENLSETVTTVTASLTANLPKIIEAGTQIITGLVGKLTEAMPMLAGVAIQIIQTLTEAITSNLPAILQAATGILTSLVEGIAFAIPALLVVATQVITTLINAFAGILPQIITVGIGIITALLNGIITALPIIIEAAMTVVNSLVEGIIAILPMLLEVGLQIIVALLDAIVTALPMLIEVGTQVITTLVTSFITLLPTLIEAGVQMLMALLAGIISILPLLINAAIQIVMALLGALISALPQIIAAGIQLLMALIQGIISILPQLIAAAIQIITALIGGLIQMLPQIIEAGVKLLVALIGGIVSILPQLVSAGINLIVQLAAAIISQLPNLLAAGVKLIGALIQGILSLIGQLLAAGGRLISGLLSKITGFFGDMLSAGADLIGKLIDGIARGGRAIGGAIEEILSTAWNKITGWFDTFKNAGANLVGMIADGISSAVHKVTDAIGSVVGKVRDFLPFSPAKVGPLSDLDKLNFGGTISTGIYAGESRVQKAMADLTGGLKDSLNQDIPQLAGLFNGGLTAESAIGMRGMNSVNNSSYSTSNSSVTINNQGLLDGAVFNVREEADIPKVAKAIKDYEESQNPNRYPWKR
nr:MAG TPA: tail tape measure protein [Caudoviricetes sp.]